MPQKEMATNTSRGPTVGTGRFSYTTSCALRRMKEGFDSCEGTIVWAGPELAMVDWGLWGRQEKPSRSKLMPPRIFMFRFLSYNIIALKGVSWYNYGCSLLLNLTLLVLGLSRTQSQSAIFSLHSLRNGRHRGPNRTRVHRWWRGR